MKKLSLDLEQIAVESFETDAEAQGRGTVQAHEWSEGLTRCGTMHCGGTCFESCWTDCW